jgi:hypothetical protein
VCRVLLQFSASKYFLGLSDTHLRHHRTEHFCASSCCSVELGLLIHTESWPFSAVALGYSLGCFRHYCFPYGIVVVRNLPLFHPRARPRTRLASSERVSKSPTAADFSLLLVPAPRVQRQALGPSSQAQSGQKARFDADPTGLHHRAVSRVGSSNGGINQQAPPIFVRVGGPAKAKALWATQRPLPRPPPSSAIARGSPVLRRRTVTGQCRHQRRTDRAPALAPRRVQAPSAVRSREGASVLEGGVGGPAGARITGAMPRWTRRSTRSKGSRRSTVGPMTKRGVERVAFYLNRLTSGISVMGPPGAGATPSSAEVSHQQRRRERRRRRGKSKSKSKRKAKTTDEGVLCVVYLLMRCSESCLYNKNEAIRD